MMLSLSNCGSLGNGVFSRLEVVVLLLGADSHELALVLGEAESAGLGALVSEILWSVLLSLPLGLLSISSLLVEDGEHFGDALSNNL